MTAATVGTEGGVSNIDVIRRFYALPRNTAAERGELLAMLDDDIEYVGIGKEGARGRAAIERLFSKYEGGGQSDIRFDIRHIAENGDTVLVDMVDYITIAGRTIDVAFSNVFKVRNGRICYWQEHYDRGRLEGAFPRPIPVTEAAAAAPATTVATARSPRDVAELWLGVLARADLAAWDALVADEVRMEFPFAPAGIPSRCEGRDACRKVVGAFFAAIERFEWYDIALHAAADPELVFGFAKSRARLRSGRDYGNDYCMLLRVRAGRLLEYREYFNPLPAIAAFS